MGWNDRLPEDPYWPDIARQDDRDSYENWLQYLDEQLEDANAELSSQNLTLEDLRRLTGIRTLRTERFDEEESCETQNQENNQKATPENTDSAGVS